MRVMYWPNEPAHLYPGFRQEGGRAAFEAMAEDGTIVALSIYSYRVERAKFPDAARFEAAAFEAVHAFAPDLLFLQHVCGAPLPRGFCLRLRRRFPQTTLIFHEDDPFDRLVKRIDPLTSDAAAAADLVLLSGKGGLARLFRSKGAQRIGYLPSCFNRHHFATRDPAAASKTCQIAMIGNRGRRRRLKLLYVPGGRRRARFAARLSQLYGSEFALYGHGWSHLPSARGALPFFEQEAAIQSARISANWDHFDTIASYFSDRLPISLAAGVPHVTTWHEGYDELFRDCPGLYACKSVDEAVEACRRLLGRPDAELREEGLAAREWAFAHLEANVVFKRAIERAVVLHRARAGGPA